MENKEVKNKQKEELNEEALEEVTGGVYQVSGLTHDDALLRGKKSPSVKTTTPATGAVGPKTPTGGSVRKF